MYALCAGGDYSDGIPMCGPETAFAVVRLTFGDSLLTALETLSGAALTDFLAVWRQQVRHVLNTNPNKVLPRARPSLLDHITDTFPDVRVAELYRMPITTWSTSPEVVFNWLPRLPRPGVNANFCEARFGWDTALSRPSTMDSILPSLPRAPGRTKALTTRLSVKNHGFIYAQCRRERGGDGDSLLRPQGADCGGARQSRPRK